MTGLILMLGILGAVFGSVGKGVIDELKLIRKALEAKNAKGDDKKPEG